jgi:uncharacterized protein YjbI with pentapeptide repeats
MANPEHVAKLKESVAAWNVWREAVPTIPDLHGADLTWANLSSAHLGKANQSTSRASSKAKSNAHALPSAQKSAAETMGSLLHG